ncbi:MAG: endosialidase [Lachnospiraceae bacterium]|nr:endosialidase [Lachnospiraceae bacterium]
MPAEIIAIEQDQTLSFGNYKLEEKAKVEDFAFQGDLLKVKTYKTMTKLEKNGMFLYESVPGTTVKHFQETEEGVTFQVEAESDAQLTIGLAEQTSYEVLIEGELIGVMDTGLGGKLNVNVEPSEGKVVRVEIRKA